MKRTESGATHPSPTPRSWKTEYDWAFAHYPELVTRYPNEWIAFANQQVLAHGKALRPVLTQAKRKRRGREIPHLFVEQGIHVYAHSP